jgi:RHS repeat-associated protein
VGVRICCAIQPWGKELMHTAPGALPFGFAGGLHDADTGFLRFGVRDYDPFVGRWTAKDPILFRGGVNLYSYVDSDVVNKTDPNVAVGWCIQHFSNDDEHDCDEEWEEATEQCEEQLRRPWRRRDQGVTGGATRASRIARAAWSVRRVVGFRPEIRARIYQQTESNGIRAWTSAN